MKLTITPRNPLRGELRLAGDKSISHRAALFAAMAQGESSIQNFLIAGVTEAMLQGLSVLGVQWALHGTSLKINGNGLSGLYKPSKAIHCGNSGTTLRLLAGALTAANVSAILTGSEGLRQRPMMRIVAPLQAAGAKIDATSGGTAPLTLMERPENRSLSGEKHVLPVASAQVKTALMLAALAADSPTTIVEPEISRDHTERMLAAMGVQIEEVNLDGQHQVRVFPLDDKQLSPLNMAIPGDFSSAAFLIVAALVTPGSEVLIKDVGLNPTRTGILHVLQSMGADIQIKNERVISLEPVGDIKVRYSKLQGVQVSGKQVVKMIDEFPALAVAGAYAIGDTLVSEATELRHKESDRISSICTQLKNIGTTIEERPDGFMIRNSRPPVGGEVAPHGDHRLAMSLAVCGLGAQSNTTIHDAEIFTESYPQFVEDLILLGADIAYD